MDFYIELNAKAAVGAVAFAFLYFSVLMFNAR